MDSSFDSRSDSCEKRLLMTGGTGFIGRFLIPKLLASGWQVVVLSRQSRNRVAALLGNEILSIRTLPEWPFAEPPTACINLAGEGIMDKRWSAARKRVLRESRIGLTHELAQWLKQWPQPLGVLISGSAVGYYGSHTGDSHSDEKSPAGEGFAAQLCIDWEQAAAEIPAQRCCLIRTGLVLHAGHGMLAKLLPPFRLGAGGPVGSGRQVMPWIHIDDMVGAILHLLNQPQASGAFNMVAPNAVTNSEFAAALGQAVRRPAFLPLPAPVLRVLLGEGAELVLKGQRPIPAALERSGFTFCYPRLESALADLLG